MLNMSLSALRDDEPHAPVYLDTLATVPLFAEFTPEELTEIGQLVTVRRYTRGQLLVREGDPGQALYVILAGSAAVQTEAGNRTTILALLKARDFFGEMSLFDGTSRSATVRALTSVEAAIIERDDFLLLLERSSRIARLFLGVLVERLRAANVTISSATTRDAKARVASLLLDLSENFGETHSLGTRIALRLTNREMARMVGTTRETVNRTLNGLWDERIVDMSTLNVVVTDVGKLRDAAGAKRVEPNVPYGEEPKANPAPM